jgi:seryl-tRNA synthetase
MNIVTEPAMRSALPGAMPDESGARADDGEGEPPERSYRDELLDAGVLVDTGVAGVYGRSETFDNVIDGIGRMIDVWGEDLGAEVLRFPPLLNRFEFERSEFFNSCPTLAGSIHCFCGDERAHVDAVARIGRHDPNWLAHQQPADVVLAPAACYPVYPLVARRGALPEAGVTLDVFAYCFRHEPSLDPARMQMFRMREYVRIADPERIVAFRALWLERAQRMTRALALPFAIDVANDPFFGRGGRVVAEIQRREQLKFELLIPIADMAKPTACMSFNLHRDHFGRIWDLRTQDGEIAHSGCVGFGMERIALALFRHHGLDVLLWPAPVRDVLGLG